MTTLAGVELGGTKVVVVRGQSGRIDERIEVPTAAPDSTLAAVRAALARWHDEFGVNGLGLAAFGPIRVNTAAPDFGRLQASPKPGWSGVDVYEALAAGLGAPARLDTDVNAAALAERQIGAAQGCDSLAYITIGTGVGVGLIGESRPLHGALHPEMGHVRLRRAASDDFAGACPFHGDCVEGLIAGPSLAQRFGLNPAEVSAKDRRWKDAAADLAELLALLLVGLSVERIVVGGGVGLGQPQLLELARARVPTLLAGYGDARADADLARLIVPAALGADAGPHGALILAERAAA